MRASRGGGECQGQSRIAGIPRRGRRSVGSLALCHAIPPFPSPPPSSLYVQPRGVVVEVMPPLFLLTPHMLHCPAVQLRGAVVEVLDSWASVCGVDALIPAVGSGKGRGRGDTGVGECLYSECRRVGK